jgi:hypothetical protein
MACSQGLPLPCLLQWFLEHDSSGNEREKVYNPNLLDASAPDVLVGYLQWLEGGMPGYEGRARGEKMVGGSSPPSVPHHQQLLHAQPSANSPGRCLC